VKEGENGLIWLGNVTDFEALGVLMPTPEQEQLDIDDGVISNVLTMQAMGG